MRGHLEKLKAEWEWEIREGGESAKGYLIKAKSVCDRNCQQLDASVETVKIETAHWGQGERQSGRKVNAFRGNWKQKSGEARVENMSQVPYRKKEKKDESSWNLWSCVGPALPLIKLI